MNEYYQMYLEELNGITPCSAEEEDRLLTQIAEGNAEAKARLTEGMLWFALEIAKEYEKNGIFLEDLVQEANMALIQFVEEYEYGDFRPQLASKIHQALEEYLEIEDEESKIEEEMRARANVLQEVSRDLAEELGREATLEELAEKMKMTEDEVREVMKMSMNALTVDRMM